jgi:predicted Abi (CAAX) family protease
MRTVKSILAVLVILTVVVISTAALFAPVEAGQSEPVYNAGFKLYDAEGKAMGCDCPATNGSCVCITRPLT